MRKLFSACIVIARIAWSGNFDVLDLSAAGFAGSSDLKGFRGGFSVGGYGYLNPSGDNPGKVPRFALDRFTHASMSFLDLASVDPELVNLGWGFSDDTYGYMVTQRAGKIVRFQLESFSTADISVLNVANVNPVLIGFTCGFADGQYGFLAGSGVGNEFHGRVVIFELSAFSESRVWTVDLSSKEASLTGFKGCFRYGGHGYVLAADTIVSPRHCLPDAICNYGDCCASGSSCNTCPGGYSANTAECASHGDHRCNGVSRASVGKVARFDLGTFPLLSLADVEVLALDAMDPTLISFSGLFSDDTYGYLVPGATAENDRRLARFSLSSFNIASVQVIDVAAVSGDTDLNTFLGGFTDGTVYGYLVPAEGKGKIARFDSATFSSVDVIDLMASDPTLNGFNYAFTDEHRQMAYLVPYKSFGPLPGDPTSFGKVVRMHIEEPPMIETQVPVEWTDLNSAEPATDGGIQQIGGTWQSCYASTNRPVLSLTWKFLAQGESFFGFCCGSTCAETAERGPGRCHFAVYMAHGGAANKWYVQDGSSTGQIHQSSANPDWANDEWSLRQKGSGLIEYLRNGNHYYTSVSTPTAPFLQIRFDAGTPAIDGAAGIAYVHATGLSLNFSQASDSYVIYNGYPCRPSTGSAIVLMPLGEQNSNLSSTAACRKQCDQRADCRSYDFYYIRSTCTLYSNPGQYNLETSPSNLSGSWIGFCGVKTADSLTTVATTTMATTTSRVTSAASALVVSTSSNTMEASTSSKGMEVKLVTTLRGSLTLEISNNSAFVNEPNVSEVMKIAIAELMQVDVAWISNVRISLVDRRLLFSSGELRQLELTTTTKSGIKIDFQIDIPPDGGVAKISPTIIVERFDSFTLQEATETIDRVVKSNLLTGGKSYEVKVSYKFVIIDTTTTTVAVLDESEGISPLTIMIPCAALACLCCVASVICYFWMSRQRDAEHKVSLRAHQMKPPVGVDLQYLFPPESITAECKEVLNTFLASVLDATAARVFITFALGRRSSDVEDSGPGAFYACAVVKSLRMHDIPSYAFVTGITTDESCSKIVSDPASHCRTMIILESEALYHCRVCLNFIHMAIDSNMELVLLRFEASPPAIHERWTDVLGEDVGTAAVVKQKLKILPDIPLAPMTVQLQPEVLDTLAIDIKMGSNLQLTLQMRQVLYEESCEEVGTQSAAQKITKSMSRTFGRMLSQPKQKSKRNKTATRLRKIGSPESQGSVVPIKSPRSERSRRNSPRPDGSHKEKRLKSKGPYRIYKASTDMGPDTGSPETSLRKDRRTKDKYPHGMGKASSDIGRAMSAMPDIASGDKKADKVRKQAIPSKSASSPRLVSTSIGYSSFSST